MKLVITENTLAPGLARLENRFPKAYKLGQGVAGLSIIQDALTQEPRVPRDTGFLRGSWGIYTGTSQVSKGERGSLPGSISEKENTVTVVFNAKYAAAVHERLAPKGAGKPSTPGTGGGFLVDKMSNNKSKYAEIFAREFKKGMGI